jgi:tetratricopeptide (TPR) repeat protein
MKTSFTVITAAWRNNRLARFFLALALAAPAVPAFGFKTDPPQATPAEQSIFERLEAGQLQEGKDPATFLALANGDYAAALAALPETPDPSLAWYRSYLQGTIEAFSGLVEVPGGRHFRLFVPRGQEFLADYALPSLEKAGDHFERVFGHRPHGQVRVEIYPDKESFSAASTLSLDTLERSGAIGICKFHRLMILSPRALPIGYRWMDALSHEYVHLLVNELTWTKAELWLHEGTARYFETSYRLDPPVFLTPSQKTALLEAREKGELVPFRRMSPSMVYLKDQAEVSLAFAQVSHAVDLMIREKGLPSFRKFFDLLRRSPFPSAFQAVYKMTPETFETRWRDALGKEKWERARGALSDEVRFEGLREEESVGAGAQARMRLGDRMRMRGQMEAALIEYDKALAEEPDNAIVLLKAARTRLAMDRRDEATGLLRRAVEKNPNYGTPMIELAGLVADNEAGPLLLEANALNPFDPRIHRMLSEIHSRAGRAEQARREGEIATLLGG